jgi:magnesium transporter
MTWHEISDPGDPRLDELARQYQLHPLHVEDCRHRNQRAKVEADHGYLFIVLKLVTADSEGDLNVGDLDLFLGSDYLITVEETNCPAVHSMLGQATGLARRLRPDQLVYRILDGVIDSYLPVLDGMSDRLDRLEDAVLNRPRPEMLQELFSTKRCLLEMRRILTNMRDVCGFLLRTETAFINADLQPFLRDAYDHTARSLDLVETYRDLVTGTVDLYLSSVANETNNVMKRLAVISTIALPGLLLTGTYGMNVKGMPWAELPHGGWMVLAVIAALTAGLLIVMRIRRWI